MGLWRTFTGYCVFTLAALRWQCGGECPPDTAALARQCFANFTWGVAAIDDDNGLNDIRNGGGTGHSSDPYRNLHQESRTTESRSGLRSGSGSEDVNRATVPLDYRKIREYCAEGGHMLRFVHCVEELSRYCPDLPPDGAFGQLINPQRVRTSVPSLCSHENDIEEKSECMNNVIKQRSPCKERAYNSILNGPTRSMFSSNNYTRSSFFVQCRYLSALAECQRTAMSERCGDLLGHLHANLLLSFVPGLCHLPQAPHGAGSPQDHRDPRPPHGDRPGGNKFWKDLKSSSGILLDLPKPSGPHLGTKGRWSTGGGRNSTTEGYGGTGPRQGPGEPWKGQQTDSYTPDSSLGQSDAERSPRGQITTTNHQTATRKAPNPPPVSTTSAISNPAGAHICGSAEQEVTPSGHVTSAREMTSVPAWAATQSHVSRISVLRRRKTSVAAAARIYQRTSCLALNLLVVFFVCSSPSE